jgi:hypothetical protein
MRVSDLMIERYNLGELDGAERARFEERLASDPLVRARLEALRASDAQLRKRFPASVFFKQQGRKPIRAWPLSRAKRRALGAGIAAALVMCASFSFLVSIHTRKAPLPFVARAENADRAKGALRPSSRSPATLALYGKTNKDERLSPDTPLHEGDTVQLAYIVPAGGPRYGVIFSLDSRGVLTPHYPYTREAPASESALESGRQVFLREAYTLDDAPEFELFFFVISDAPLNLADTLDAARAIPVAPGRALDAARAAFPGCEVETFSIKKARKGA